MFLHLHHLFIFLCCSFPLEMHIVCKNTKYATLSSAVANLDGLAVLGVMFEVNTSIVLIVYRNSTWWYVSIVLQLGNDDDKPSHSHIKNHS